MKTIEKLIPAALTILILFNASACGSAPQAVAADMEDYVPQTKIETTAAAETPLDEIEYKTIEPPEDGWTLELLNEVTYINGKDIDLPFCVNDLGEDFSFGDVEYSSVSDKTKINIYYKNEKAFVCYISHLGKDFDEYDKITTFMLMPNKNESELDLSKFLVINGYNLSMNEERGVACFGENYTKYANNGITYKVGSKSDIFTILFADKTKNPENIDSETKNVFALYLWSDSI
jgi:hypothetical protein